VYEVDKTVRCGGEDVPIRTVGLSARSKLVALQGELLAIGRLGDGPIEAGQIIDWAGKVGAILSDVQEVEVVAECPFEGSVLVTVMHDLEHWTCPLCRTDHQEATEF
jgi:hypothetical protein